MHHKNIKLIIRKQLKQQFPNWKNLNRKNKKEISRKVLAEVITNYNFEQEITAPKEDLLGKYRSNLIRCRNLPSLRVVRVQRLCQLNSNGS